MELQKREENKDEKQIGKPNRKRKKGKRYLHKKKKNICIVSQRKAFCGQTIPELTVQRKKLLKKTAL